MTNEGINPEQSIQLSAAFSLKLQQYMTEKAFTTFHKNNIDTLFTIANFAQNNKLTPAATNKAKQGGTKGGRDRGRARQSENWMGG